MFSALDSQKLQTKHTRQQKKRKYKNVYREGIEID